MKKKSNKVIFSKNDEEQMSIEDDEDDEQISNRKGRQDNSLAVLTKKFVQLIKNTDNQTIDLNEAVNRLKVQKRRIYDITNVLQGIGYVEKTHKNTIKWIGGGEDQQVEHNLNIIRKKIESVSEAERKLDEQISSINNKIKNQYLENQQLKDYLYITYEDCQNISKQICKEQNSSIIILSAPKGSTLEANEDEEGNYQLVLNSNDKGPMKAFIVHPGTKIKQYTQQQQ